jgi:BMFP domain-containing protein YqiC
MTERPKFFDDLAGVAGGAFSARMDEAIRKLELVRRDQFDAMATLATTAREAQIAAEARLDAIEHRLAALESAASGASETILLPTPED